MPTPSSPDSAIAPVIRIVRGQRVILDADLARLYEVPTKRFNEAVRRNRERFPDDFCFQLTREEAANLIPVTMNIYTIQAPGFRFS